MFGLLALLFTLANAQDERPKFNPHPNGFVPTQSRPCEVSQNGPSGLNYFGCNNAGKCIRRGRECDCCDPYDSDNWCYDFTLDDGSRYPHEKIYIGTYCNTIRDYVAVAPLGWNFQTGEGEEPVLTCSDYRDGVFDPNACPEKSGDCQHSHNIARQVAFAFKYPCNADCSAVDDTVPSFDAIFISTGCQTCTVANPCTNAQDLTAYTTGISFGFTTFFNSFYDRTGCMSTELVDPPPCPANTDHGALARATYEGARGATRGDSDADNDLTVTRTLSAVLRGVHPLCGDPEHSAICQHGLKNSENKSFSDNNPVISEPLRFANVYRMKDTAPNHILSEFPTKAPTASPTDPTPDPTPAPTVPDDKCFRYNNELMDHKFLGSAENCRGGFNPSWTGGKTCDSPYIICLPQENTPKNPDPNSVPNFGQSLPATDYSVMECAAECAYDQRCSGFELRPVVGSARGECMMIDDNEVIPENMHSWPAVGADAESTAHIASGLAVKGAEMNGRCCANEELAGPFLGGTEAECRDKCYDNMKCNFFSYSSVISGGFCTLCKSCPSLSSPGAFASWPVTGRLELGNPPDYDNAGAALCFAKKDYCNPYFEANELTEEMLQCYCPNNRKGTYTKKVKRTVENTRFCDSGDAAVTERIKKAQANRMFHLCENWCLFETHNPMTESWYWNPWLKCWREQYAGTGEHDSYCMRVIREPNTIEQIFINKRSDMFCDKDATTGEVLEVITEEPTGSPSTFASTWFLAEEEDSCDDACADQGMVCDELTTNSLVDGQDTLLTNAVTQAGESCSSSEIGPKGWALPGYESDTGKCLLRHQDTEYVGCNWATGVGYKRVCACYSP